MNQSDAHSRADQTRIFFAKFIPAARLRLKTCSHSFVNKMCTMTTYSGDWFKKYDILCAFC
jgi:hypothetical protein